MILDIIRHILPLEVFNCLVLLFSFVDLNVLEHHVDVFLKLVLLAVTILYTTFKAFNESRKWKQ